MTDPRSSQQEPACCCTCSTTSPDNSFPEPTFEEKLEMLKVVMPFYTQRYGCSVCGKTELEMLDPHPRELIDDYLVVTVCNHCGNHTVFNVKNLF